jgi:hypothetical protein
MHNIGRSGSLLHGPVRIGLQGTNAHAILAKTGSPPACGCPQPQRWQRAPLWFTVMANALLDRFAAEGATLRFGARLDVARLSYLRGLVPSLDVDRPPEPLSAPGVLYEAAQAAGACMSETAAGSGQTLLLGCVAKPPAELPSSARDQTQSVLQLWCRFDRCSVAFSVGGAGEGPDGQPRDYLAGGFGRLPSPSEGLPSIRRVRGWALGCSSVVNRQKGNGYERLPCPRCISLRARLTPAHAELV